MDWRDRSLPNRLGVPGGRRLSRYDLVLAVVPVSFLLALVVGGIAGVPTRVAVTSAAVVGAIALADGLFLNPPRRPRPREGGT